VAPTRLVGLRRAQELILGGRVLDAAEALDWGLVTQVEPAERLNEVALERARALASGPTYALGRMKRLLRESGSASYPEQLAAERRRSWPAPGRGRQRGLTRSPTAERPVTGR